MPKSKSNGRPVTLEGTVRGLDTSASVDPAFRKALQTAVAALQRIAEYKLERPIARLMTEMGERKEFLDEEEHDLLMAFVEFSERRSVEKLAAQVALKRLREALPTRVRDL